MAYSIYDKFLTISDCKYYCKQVAKQTGLSMFDYFYDKHTETQLPGDFNIYHEFQCNHHYELWQIKFNLTKPKTIMKMGLNQYVLEHKELRFHLTIKGHSFLYICKFSHPQVVKPIRQQQDDDDNKDNNKLLYNIQDNGQLSFIL